MKRQKRCAVLITLLALTMHASVFAADILDGLIGYWPFDKGEGDAAHDLVGGHDGSIKRAAWTDRAKSGKWALQFSPEDDAKVVIPDAEELDNLPDGHTVTNWIWPVSRGAMMDKSGGNHLRIQWFFFDDGRLHWGSGPNFAFSAKPVSFRKWSHVAWSHSADLSVVYVNGEKFHEELNMGAPIPTGEPMIFGRSGIIADGNPRQQNFEGIMDDFGLWNRPLSDKEVKEVFERGLGNILAVSPHGKMTTTWAAVKAEINNP